MTPTYDVVAVPPSGTEASRYELNTTPAGWDSHPGETAVLCYDQLLQQLLQAIPERVPEAKTVELFRVSIAEDGSYALVARGSFTGVVTREPARSGRFTAKALGDGALLDSFFRREDAWEKYRDADAWEAARDLAERTALPGSALRKLNDGLALALLLRAGIEAKPWDLP